MCTCITCVVIIKESTKPQQPQQQCQSRLDANVAGRRKKNRHMLC